MQNSGDTGTMVDGLLSRLQAASCQPELDLVGVPGRFRAPPEWDTGEVHLRDAQLLYYVVAGRVAASVAGRDLQVAPQGLLWMMRGQSLRCTRATDDPLVLLRVRLRISKIPRIDDPFLHRESFPQGETWCTQLVDEANRVTPTPARIRGLLLCLLTDLQRESSSDCLSQLSVAQRNAVESAAVVDPWLSLADLAAAAQLSPDYFSRMFRRSYGQTVQRWLVERRIAMARTYLLESTMSVTAVADALGYRDVFYFSRQFRQIAGISPSALRRKSV